MSEFGLRIATGVGLVVVVLVGTLMNTIAFAFVFGGIGLFCLIEYFGLVFSHNEANTINLVRRILGIVLASLPFLIVFFLLKNEETTTSPAIFGSIIIGVFFMMLFEMFANSQKPIKNMGFTSLGIFYIGIPFGMLLLLQDMQSPKLILGMILLVFMNDSLAYLTGRSFGKTPLFPRISPKKTWEGAIGGVIFTLLLAVVYTFVPLFNFLSLKDWLAVAVIVAIFGPLGDLVESMFKRNLKIKDSGSLLPGHGGFLDRFDALIFTIPFVTMYFWLT
ncbi:MAG: phosphatidate cytidylyltransferase [Saprospiraceae bacterium]